MGHGVCEFFGVPEYFLCHLDWSGKELVPVWLYRLKETPGHGHFTSGGDPVPRTFHVKFTGLCPWLYGIWLAITGGDKTSTRYLTGAGSWEVAQEIKRYRLPGTAL